MNQPVYFLSNYNWEKGTIVSEGPRNFKIFVSSFGYKEHIKSVSKEKCAAAGESVCVVWETWRGKNGRGGYRVERELYPHRRVPAEQVLRQGFGAGRVIEKEFGVER